MRMEFPGAAAALDRLIEWLEERGYSGIDHLSVCCPQQLSGRTPNGTLFYYRFRHGSGSLIIDDRADDIEELIGLRSSDDVLVEIRQTPSGEYDGWMPFEEATKMFEVVMELGL